MNTFPDALVHREDALSLYESTPWLSDEECFWHYGHHSMKKRQKDAPPAWKSIGRLVHVLLPSVKMKARSKGSLTHERDFHNFLVSQFEGYTVTGGNITGYWKKGKEEECNEHREYQIAISRVSNLETLQQYLAKLASRLKERSVFCSFDGHAYLVEASKGK